MYSLALWCQLPPFHRSLPPCQDASTTTTPLSGQPHADPEELRSTWPQRAWTLAGAAAILSSLFTCARVVAATGSVIGPLAAAFAAYSFADLTTGVYHWFIDNYGDADTPIIGETIAAFLDHHRHPTAITRLEPCNLLHRLARAVAIVLPVVDAALSASDSPAAAHVFACVFAAFVMLSVQVHAWAHEKRRRLPPGVEALQAAAVLVSGSKHAGHHRPPYNTNYCSISGMWNGVLDRYKVFQALEAVFYHCSGVQPRSWGEPNAMSTELTKDDVAVKATGDYSEHRL